MVAYLNVSSIYYNTTCSSSSCCYCCCCVVSLTGQTDCNVLRGWEMQKLVQQNTIKTWHRAVLQRGRRRDLVAPLPHYSITQLRSWEKVKLKIPLPSPRSVGRPWCVTRVGWSQPLLSAYNYKEDFKDDLISQHWHRFTAIGFHGLKCSVYILFSRALRWDGSNTPK